jgi:glycine dehydrogenase subunit 1
MSYIPNSKMIRQKMLDDIGVPDFENLIDTLPADVRLNKPLDIPKGVSEIDLSRIVNDIACENTKISMNFAGGGAYDHFCPAAVDHILLRSEFYTAYTPYQAEISQGTLQAIYEFQTYINRLTGLQVTNASMYDGASALAEAVMMAVAHTRRNEVLISSSVNPNYIKTVRTYLSGQNIVITEIPLRDGLTDIKQVSKLISDKTAAVAVQTPNFLGLLEDMNDLSATAKKSDALFISVYDPATLGLISPPGEYGADIAVGDGQSLGLPLNFGGPYLGLFSASKDFIRKIPGRLVGRTKDSEGRVGYVLTLQTREQHIRRDRATSNICTNQALCALAATVYLSLIGESGLEKIGRLCLAKSHYAAEKINAIPGFNLKFNGSFIKEFVIETPAPPAEIITELAKHGISPGVDLGKFDIGLNNCMMIAVTEKRSRQEIDLLVDELSKFSK